MTTATRGQSKATAKPEPTPTTELEDGGRSIPWPLYPLAPFVIIPALLLGLWMLPAIIFAALTVRAAVKIQSNAWSVLYAITFGIVFVASFAWPFALTWGLSEVF
jgi:hypothetical protein